MTSSVNDLSDSSGPDEQQQQSQPEVQNLNHANGKFQLGMPGLPAPPPVYMMPRGQLEEGQTMAQTAYPYIDPYYGSIIAAYGGQAVMHPHMMGVLQPGLPLPADAVEEPVYVNAKQYHGILRRRQSRAKAESENKLIKSRKLSGADIEIVDSKSSRFEHIAQISGTPEQKRAAENMIQAFILST